MNFLLWVPIFLSQGRGLVFDPQGGCIPPPPPPPLPMCGLVSAAAPTDSTAAHSSWSTRLTDLRSPAVATPCSTMSLSQTATPYPKSRSSRPTWPAKTYIFFKVDLVHGYHHIPVAQEDVPVITLFGLFELLCMTFDLCNAAQTFQCLMVNVCRPGLRLRLPI